MAAMPQVPYAEARKIAEWIKSPGKSKLENITRQANP